MKKNLLIALFATATMAGVAQARLDSGGNWTIAMELDTVQMTQLINNENAAWTNTGTNLVEFTGGSLWSAASGFEPQYTEKRNVSYWMGWGNYYFTAASTGMASGLQMGFFEGTSSQNAEHSTAPGAAADLNTGDTGAQNAGYYRAHTKYEGVAQTMDGHMLTGAGSAEYTGQGDLTKFTKIESITLVLVHKNPGGFLGDLQSQTKQYLTVTGTVEGSDEAITICYEASIDDVSGSPSFTQGILPGSGRYDVDYLESVRFDNGKGGMVVSGNTYAGAWSEDQVKEFHAQASAHTPPGGDTSGAAVPEPTTATLSLLALAGLCARRRRR